MDGSGPFTEYKDETRIFSYITMSHSISASSTSARTYTIRGRKYNSSVSDLNIGVGSAVVGTQSFTVMEISG